MVVAADLVLADAREDHRVDHDPVAELDAAEVLLGEVFAEGGDRRPHRLESRLR